MAIEVDVPVPGAPDSGDVVEKGGELGSWFADRPEAFWTLVVIAVLALVITTPRMMAATTRPRTNGRFMSVVALALL